MRDCCLSINDLQALVAGEFKEEEDATLHFRGCGKCQAAAEVIMSRLSGNAFLPAKGSNPDVFTEIDELLEVLKQQKGSGHSASVGAGCPDADNQAQARLIGPYHLREKLGEGGFGIVFRAEQFSPICRTVALKVIKPELVRRDVVARFENERQSLVLMQHPHIARVLDAGTTSDGEPFFAMELVAGMPVTEYCDKNNLGVLECLNLFLTICDAIQHAHQKGVIHRDLKPSNILISDRDGVPDAKVIDFGIAKAFGQTIDDGAAITAIGQFVGTPPYMSPEQIGASRDVDTRSDVYSLGAILYELLSGAPPFDPVRLKKLEILEMVRVIQEEEPSKPSDRLQLQRAKVQHSSESFVISVWLRRVCGDLDWICLKAIEKNRERRYSSPKDLADDIVRHLNHEPVAARPPSMVYLFRKLVRRHRVLIVATTAVFVAMVGGITVAAWQAIVANAERVRADDKANLASQAETRAKAQAALAIQRGETADRERTRAENKARLAESVVDRFYLDVAEEWVRNSPYMTPVEEKFLTAAAEFYQQVAAETPTSAGIQQKLAETQQRVAILSNRLGKDSEAENAFRRALEVFSTLESTGQASMEVRIQRAKCRVNYGEFLQSHHNHKSAEQQFKAALDQLNVHNLEDLSGKQVHFLRALALRGQAETTGDVKFDRQSAMRAAIKTLTELVAASENDVTFQFELATTHLLIADSKYPDSKSHLCEGIRMLERLVEEKPAVEAFRWQLARSRHRLFEAFPKDGTPEYSQSEKAVEELWYLVRIHPENLVYLIDLVYAQSQRDLFRSLATSGAGIDSLKELVAYIRGQMNIRPKPELDVAFAYVNNHLGHVCLLAGQDQLAREALQDAVTAWERYIHDHDNPDEQWWCLERLSVAYKNLGRIGWRIGGRDAGIKHYMNGVLAAYHAMVRRGQQRGHATGHQPLITALKAKFGFNWDYFEPTPKDERLQFEADARKELFRQRPHDKDIKRMYIIGNDYGLYLVENLGRWQEGTDDIRESMELLHSVPIAGYDEWMRYSSLALVCGRVLTDYGRELEAVDVYRTASTNQPTSYRDEWGFTYGIAKAWIHAAERQDIPDVERRCFRQMADDALVELLADLKQRSSDKTRNATRRRLASILRAPEVISVRNPVNLNSLSEDESKLWSQFWLEVEEERIKLANMKTDWLRE